MATAGENARTIGQGVQGAGLRFRLGRRADEARRYGEGVSVRLASAQTERRPASSTACSSSPPGALVRANAS